jgi:protein SCO1/2
MKHLSPALLSPILLALFATSACAETTLPRALRDVRFDQKLDAQVPLDLTFSDEAGKRVTLADYCGKKPVILVLAYYRCPMLCTLVLNGLVQALLELPFDAGREFEVVAVSFDARETPDLAAEKKKTYCERYGRPGAAAGWHFLTGDQESIDALTQAVGFGYSYDSARDQFAHASGLVVLTLTGKVSRYLYGIKFAPRDVRLGLVEASDNKIGSPVDQVLLFCFHYDPAEGKYGAKVMTFVRAGGVLTLVSLIAMVMYFLRREGRLTNAVRIPAPIGFGGTGEGGAAP